jgi:hypothetical protein
MATMNFGSKLVVGRGGAVSKLIETGTVRRRADLLLASSNQGDLSMMKIRWAVAALVIGGLASPMTTVQAMTHKHHKSSATTGSKTMGSNMKAGTTTGANTKPTSANPSSEGNVGPSTNHAGSTSKNQ